MLLSHVSTVKTTVCAFLAEIGNNDYVVYLYYTNFGQTNYIITMHHVGT